MMLCVYFSYFSYYYFSYFSYFIMATCRATMSQSNTSRNTETSNPAGLDQIDHTLRVLGYVLK